MNERYFIMDGCMFLSKHPTMICLGTRNHNLQFYCSFPACEDYGRMLGYSFHACAFLCFKGEDYLTHTNCTLLARISPQWLRELR